MRLLKRLFLFVLIVIFYFASSSSNVHDVVTRKEIEVVNAPLLNSIFCSTGDVEITTKANIVKVYIAINNQVLNKTTSLTYPLAITCKVSSIYLAGFCRRHKVQQDCHRINNQLELILKKFHKLYWRPYPQVYYDRCSLHYRVMKNGSLSAEGHQSRRTLLAPSPPHSQLITFHRQQFPDNMVVNPSLLIGYQKNLVLLHRVVINDFIGPNVAGLMGHFQFLGVKVWNAYDFFMDIGGSSPTYLNSSLQNYSSLIELPNPIKIQSYFIDANTASPDSYVSSHNILRGEDARGFTYKGEPWFSFTSDGLPKLQNRVICYAQLDFANTFVNSIPIGKLHIIDTATSILPGLDQKNWIPFEYNGELHFIFSILPHVVVKPKVPVTDREKGEVMVEGMETLELVSVIGDVDELPPIHLLNYLKQDLPPDLPEEERLWLHDFNSNKAILCGVNRLITREKELNDDLYLTHKIFHAKWKVPWDIDRYGYPLGGTRPIEVVPGYYLSIFHSSYFSYQTIRTTYYMGAYLFTKEFPFAIKAMSRAPIVPVHNLYYMDDYEDNRDSPRSHRDEDVEMTLSERTEEKLTFSTDKILFPMGLEILNPEEVIISFGYNDQKSYFLRCKIVDLLMTLEEVVDE